MPRRRYSSSSGSESGSSSDSMENTSKKAKKTESSGEIELRLESLICRIGEKSTSSLESNLEVLGKVLKSDLTHFKEWVNTHLFLIQIVHLNQIYNRYIVLCCLSNARENDDLLNISWMAEFTRWSLRFRIYTLHSWPAQWYAADQSLGSCPINDTIHFRKWDK